MPNSYLQPAQNNIFFLDVYKLHMLLLQPSSAECFVDFEQFDLVIYVFIPN